MKAKSLINQLKKIGINVVVDEFMRAKSDSLKYPTTWAGMGECWMEFVIKENGDCSPVHLRIKNEKTTYPPYGGYECRTINYIVKELTKFVFFGCIHGKTSKFESFYDTRKKKYVLNMIDPAYRCLTEFNQEDIKIIRQHDMPMEIKADYIMDRLN